MELLFALFPLFACFGVSVIMIAIFASVAFVFDNVSHRIKMYRKQRRIAASRNPYHQITEELHKEVRRLREQQAALEIPTIEEPSCSHPTSQLVDIRSNAFSHNELVATLCLACDQQLGPEVWSTRKYEELEALTRAADKVPRDADQLRRIRAGVPDVAQELGIRAEHSYQAFQADDWSAADHLASVPLRGREELIEFRSFGAIKPVRTVRPEGRPFMEAHGADPVPIVIWAVAPEVNRPKARLGEYGPISDDERAWGFGEETPIRQTVQWRRIHSHGWLLGWPVADRSRHTYSAWALLGWRVDPALDGIEKIRRVVVQLRHSSHPPVRLSFQHANDYRRFMTS